MDPTDAPTNNNWDNWLAGQSYLETSYQDTGNPSSSAKGYFQFIDSTAKRATDAGLPDPRAGGYSDQANAAKQYIQHFYPDAANAIESGDFGTATHLLRGEWPSLPGGSQQQNPSRYGVWSQILSGNGPRPGSGALTTGQTRMDPTQPPGVLNSGYGLPGVLTPAQMSPQQRWMGAADSIGQGLEGVGAWLQAPYSASGAAALLNQAQERARQRNQLAMTALLRPQWAMGTDASGRMIMYNQITGATRSIGPGGTAMPGGAGGSGADYYASGPKAQQAQAEEQNKQLQDEDNDAQTAATKSQGIIDQLLKFREHINDPNVRQGGVWGPMAAEYKNTAANAPWGLDQFLPGTEGNAATQSFEKDQTTTLSAAKDMIGNMTRFAGPEINVTTRATPSLSNPRETNNEIINQYIGAQQRVKELGQLAQAYKERTGVSRLDAGWYKVKQAYMQDPRNSLMGAAQRATSGDAAPAQKSPQGEVRYGPDGRAYVRGPNGEAVPVNQ